MCVFFFFFKQKTAYEMRISDWSSDVCSSDLHLVLEERSIEDLAHNHGLFGVAGPSARAPGVEVAGRILGLRRHGLLRVMLVEEGRIVLGRRFAIILDRKSTRLNSSH